jgi:rod shape-determining protein MreD
MRPADLTPVARDVMKVPAGAGLIFASLVAAFLVVVLPWSGWLLLARPDFVLLVLLFWTIHQPQSIGQGLAFAIGLAMDVSDSMLLGQHALAYVIAVYAAQVLRVRILSFSLGEQMLHVLGLLLGAAAVVLLLNLMLGADFPGLAIVVSPVASTLLWGPVSWILFLPGLRRMRRESRA